MRRKRRRRELVTSLGSIICPKCGEKGILQGLYRKHLNTSTVVGPYFRVIHTPRHHPESFRGDTHSILLARKGKTQGCYVGKLSAKELDQLVKRRPWPITAEDALRRLKRFEEEG